jgi:hypothetical protein
MSCVLLRLLTMPLFMTASFTSRTIVSTVRRGFLDVADSDVVGIWTVARIDHVLMCKFSGISLVAT